MSEFQTKAALKVPDQLASLEMKRGCHATHEKIFSGKLNVESGIVPVNTTREQLFRTLEKLGVSFSVHPKENYFTIEGIRDRAGQLVKFFMFEAQGVMKAIWICPTQLSHVKAFAERVMTRAPEVFPLTKNERVMLEQIIQGQEQRRPDRTARSDVEPPRKQSDTSPRAERVQQNVSSELSRTASTVNAKPVEFRTPLREGTAAVQLTPQLSPQPIAAQRSGSRNPSAAPPPEAKIRVEPTVTASMNAATTPAPPRPASEPRPTPQAAETQAPQRATTTREAPLRRRENTYYIRQDDSGRIGQAERQRFKSPKEFRQFLQRKKISRVVIVPFAGRKRRFGFLLRGLAGALRTAAVPQHRSFYQFMTEVGRPTLAGRVKVMIATR